MSKMLGKMDMVVDKLQCRNHVDRWCKANCNPHDRNELRGVSVCLVVCIQITFRFFLEGVGPSEYMIVKETGQISITGACKLRSYLQCVS